MDLLLASLYRKTYYQFCTTTFSKRIRYRYEERNRMVINEVINDMIEKIEAQEAQETQTQTPVQTPVVLEEQEKTNMDDSWCIDYGIDAVKIFHGHVPLCNVSDDSDDF
jgi:hypothetical protein